MNLLPLPFTVCFQNDYRGGEYTAVLGGGTIGMFTMQWAKIFGSKKVVVFDISEERLELAKRLGADEAINTTKEGFKEKRQWILQKEKAFPMYLRQRDRFQPCRWHLNWQQIKQMSVSSELPMWIYPLRLPCGKT